MKVKLAVLEKDTNYLHRIVSALTTKYPEQFVVFSFSDIEIAMEALTREKIEVFVVSDAFEIDAEALPKRCAFAYLIDSPNIESLRGQPALCRFQKIDQIYRQILSIYSDKVEVVTSLNSDPGKAKVLMFNSPAGGVGTSSLAAAASVFFAVHGKKTLYLNLERFGSSDLFFSGEGRQGMYDVVFALKSKKTNHNIKPESSSKQEAKRSNLTIKLESVVKRDESGVYFYSQAKTALNMLELNCDDVLTLLAELKGIDYDVIVVDADFRMDSDGLKIMEKANTCVWVSDGSEIANAKVKRAFDGLTITEQKSDIRITNRLVLIYNRFSSRTGQRLNDVDIKMLFGAGKYEHATTAQIIHQLSSKEEFAKLL